MTVLARHCWYNTGSAIHLSFIGPCLEKTVLNCSFHKSALEDELVNNRSPAFKEVMPDLSVSACFKKDQNHLLHVDLWSWCKLLSPSNCSDMLFTYGSPSKLFEFYELRFLEICDIQYLSRCELYWFLNFEVLVSVSDQAFQIGINPGQIVCIPCCLDWDKCTYSLSQITSKWLPNKFKIFFTLWALC